MSKPMYIIAALSFLCLRRRIADAYSSVCSSPPACGNVSVHYPFWLDNTSAQEYCGYPDFGLKCSDDGPPVITLPSDTYYVTDINYYLSTLTLVDTDVVNQSCPRARQNVSLENTPLSINHLDLNLSFYFNCSVSNNNYNIPATNTIGCLKNEGSKQSYVFETGSETDGYEWNIDCTEKVVVVVKEEEIRSMDLVTGFGGAMNQGFVLDWGKARDCMVCENSGGYCGFNRTTQQRLCFCKDGSIATKSCNKGTFAFS